MNSFTTCVCMCLLLLIGATPVFCADTGDRLTQRYRLAHEATDIEALQALVYWQGATQRTRELVIAKLNRFLDLAIKEIELRPLSGDESFDISGFQPNLPPIGWLAIEFEPPFESSRYRGKAFVVGNKNGKHFITIAIPAL